MQLVSGGNGGVARLLVCGEEPRQEARSLHGYKWREGRGGPQRRGQLRKLLAVDVLARWTQAAHPPGTPLSVQLEPATRLHGRFGGVTGEGALRLSLPGGGERVIHAGDVALL